MRVYADVQVGAPFLRLRNRLGTKAQRRTIHAKWAFLYRVFIQDRYDKLSRGGGEWPAKQGPGPILRVTDTLFEALRPVGEGAPGRFTKFTRTYVDVGYDQGEHPTADMSVEALATIHQRGLGVVPQRRIIVGPPNKVVSRMQKVAVDVISNGS